MVSLLTSKKNMPATSSLDANVLLDWLLERDKTRLAAINKLFATSQELHVTDLIIAEAVYVLQKQTKLSRELIADFLRRVMNEEVINCNRALTNRALPLYVEHTMLSWVDCCAVVYAELNKATPLYTFDKALAKKLSRGAKLVS